MSRTTWALALLALLAAWVMPIAQAGAKGGTAKGTHHVFATSFEENADFSEVTLPLYEGSSGGQTVWYVITDSSTKKWAARLGVNFSPKLANAAGSAAVMDATGAPTSLTFAATVDFSPDRAMGIPAPGAGLPANEPDNTFPPSPAAMGAVDAGLTAAELADAVADAGQGAYSPLAQLPDGTVLNASHVAVGDAAAVVADLAANPENHELSSNKVEGIDFEEHTVAIFETTGLFDGTTIHYVSLDASAPPGAVMENVTYSPKLAMASSGSGDPNAANSSRAGIIAFVNGQTGVDNPNRQGLNSVVADSERAAPADPTTTVDTVPLNIIQARPHASGGLYSPLWDVHLSQWEVPLAQRLLQTSFTDVAALADAGAVVGFDGTDAGVPWGPSGIVANCPAISTDRAAK